MGGLLMREPFGPFRNDCDPVERSAQLRVLRTLVHVRIGMNEEGEALEDALQRAENYDGWRCVALTLFDRLPALTRRHILGTFAYIHRPLYNSPREQSRKGTAHAHLE